MLEFTYVCDPWGVGEDEYCVGVELTRDGFESNRVYVFDNVACHYTTCYSLDENTINNIIEYALSLPASTEEQSIIPKF